jgi:hypothetical protein
LPASISSPAETPDQSTTASAEEKVVTATRLLIGLVILGLMRERFENRLSSLLGEYAWREYPAARQARALLRLTGNRRSPPASSDQCGPGESRPEKDRRHDHEPRADLYEYAQVP